MYNRVCFVSEKNMELLDFVEKMVVEEKKYAEELRNVASKLKHPVLKGLIAGVASDSEKHSVIYSALADLLKNPQPRLSEEELKVIKEGIRRHIDMEAKMIELTKKWAEAAEDSRVKLLLIAVHEDEIKHHKILIDIAEHIAEKETLPPEEEWDMVLRDSPWRPTLCLDVRCFKLAY